MENKYVIAVLVSNISGVLSRVSGMFTRRGFNIDSLTVGETESSGFSRITISFHGQSFPVQCSLRPQAAAHPDGYTHPSSRSHVCRAYIRKGLPP